MRIYLNTRGFENDYQWFNIGEDNTLTTTKNYWEMAELVNLPITDDFSIVMGKMANGELYLLITDIDSGRVDNREREIKNSLLFISEDEIILRKMITLALFDYDEFWSAINSTIIEFVEGEFGISVEYSQMLRVIDSFADRYDVKFEFDADTSEKRFSRFAELYLKYTTQSDDGEESVSYRLNPIFEFKLKRFLLSEIFPEDVDVLFAYFPELSLQNIEKAGIYLGVGRSLDRFAKNIFLRDLEDWAKIEVKESKLREIKEKLAKYRSEIFVSALAIVVFVPLVSSYIHLSSSNNELVKENLLLKAEKSEIDIERSKTTAEIVDLKQENESLLRDYRKLEDELRSEKSAFISLQKRLKREMNSETVQDLNNEILTLKNDLGRCQSERDQVSIQRQKLSVGYKWYKDLYNSCKSQGGE